ncbi:MAG: ABC transporter permease [Candidatus Sabulitectum sp.]|nr:ABC transporter permease [Candidatus Sabulitectum sp.]
MSGAIVKKGNTIMLSGRFTVGDLKEITSVLEAGSGKRMIIDLSHCDSIDTCVAARIWSTVEGSREAGLPMELQGLNPDTQAIFARFKTIDEKPLKPIPKPTLLYNFEDIGDKVLATWDTVYGLAQFTVNSFKALFSGKFRGSITAYYMEQSGVMAIPIVVTLNWLMGVVLGYQAGYQMSQFGGELFMPALLAYSICWEIAPMMTAVLVAGRSGSAFAAEIGTMKVRQELDALEVMGFNLFGYIVTPKMIALFLVMPLLITAANFAGMAGGLAAGGIFLKMPAVVYIAEVKKALIPFDLYWGIVKGLFYSTIISVTGSYMGMRVRGGPASVGRATTSAVVVSIFLVILVDALLSLLFIHIRPGLTL